MVKTSRLVVSLGMFAAACGGDDAGNALEDQDPSVVEYCDAICECENCGENGQDECVDDLGKDFEKSDDAGCRSKHAEYLDCVVAEATCSNGKFVPEELNCENEHKDLDDCVADAE